MQPLPLPISDHIQKDAEILHKGRVGTFCNSVSTFYMENPTPQRMNFNRNNHFLTR